MNIKHLPWLLGISAIIFGTVGFRHYSSKKNHPLFNTQKAERRNLLALIKAKGILIPHEIIKIGNLNNGIIAELYAQENDLVEEGQLLAVINGGKLDTEINTQFGILDAAQANLNYQTKFLNRQQQLFACKQLSLDGIQQAERDYQAAVAKVEEAKGLYEFAKLTYHYNSIVAPASGMIISKNVSVGESVSNISTPTSVLYTLAKNIRELKALIFLNSSALEIMEPNIAARMTLDTYPYTAFTSTINSIIDIPHEMGLPDYIYARLMPKITNPSNQYAIVPIDNSNLRLRPGMTFTAQITVAQKENTLSMPLKIMNISRSSIQDLAEQLDYGYQPLDNKKLLALSNDTSARTVWILSNKVFIEQAINVGINDGDFIEITQGLNGTEDIVCETNEPNSIKDILSNFLTKQSIKK
jgi:HlyD family secretion protein